MIRQKNKASIIFIIIILLCGSIIFSKTAVADINAEDTYFKSDDSITISYNNMDTAKNKGLNVKLDGLEGTNKAGFSYLNYIEVEDLAGSFLNISFIPNEVNYSDFDYILVTLTDAIDENQKLVYAVCPQPESSNYWYLWTSGWISFTDNIEPVYSQLYSNASLLGIIDEGQRIIGFNNGFINPGHPYYTGPYMDTGMLLGAKTNYFVKEKEDSALRSMSFSFSNNMAEIMGNRIADISNQDFLNASSENIISEEYKNLYTLEYVNNLFNSGFVKLDISYMGINSDSITCNIQKIGNQTFSNNVDGKILATSPLINADVKNNAVLGYKYNIPNAISSDLIDGDLSSVVYCDIYDGYNNKINITNNYVNFDKAGKYDIVYSVTNKRGNSFKKAYTINCYKDMPSTKFSTNAIFKETYYTGDTLILPATDAVNVISRNNINKVNVFVYIQIDNDVAYKTEIYNDLYYKLEKAGSYQISYVYQNTYGIVDFINYYFKVESSIAIIPRDLPVSFTANKNNNLNDFSIVNYLNESNENNLYRAIFINEQQIFLAKGDEVISGALNFNTLNSTGVAKLSYRVGFSEKNLIYKKDYDIPVVKPEYISDYLIMYDLDGNYNNNNVNITNSRTNVEFIASADKGFMLPQKIIANDLLLRFGINENFGNFSYLRIVLVSDIDNTKKLTFDLYKNSSTNSYLYVNKKTSYNVTGSFSNSNNYFELIYNDSAKLLTDQLGNKITDKITTWSDGSDFNGFENGLVIVKFEIHGAASNNKGSLILMKIANQYFGSTILSNNVQKYSDIIVPQIMLTSDVNNNDLAAGDYILVSAAEAYDVLDANTAISVSVLDPDGNYIFKNVNCDKIYKVLITEYGTYKVIYSANDSSAVIIETKKLEYSINDNQAPTVNIKENITEKCKIGESIKLPEATVYDDFTQNCNYYVIVINPNSERQVVAGEKYTPSIAGEYRIIYYCYDDNYNITQVVFYLKVTGDN